MGTLPVGHYVVPTCDSNLVSRKVGADGSTEQWQLCTASCGLISATFMTPKSNKILLPI